MAGVVAGIGEAQSHRTDSNRSAVTLTLSRLTAEITILLGVIPIKGGGIHTDSQEWDTYLKSYIMAAGKLSALPDDPHSGQRLQDVFATILKHPERELSDIPDVETLISEGPTGVDHLLFLAAWPSLRVPEVWHKIPEPMQEMMSAIQIFDYLVKLAPQNPEVEEAGVRTALYGAARKPVQSLETLADHLRTWYNMYLRYRFEASWLTQRH